MMHTILALIILAIPIQSSSIKDCKMIEKECEMESEYSSYRECIRNRMKQSIECATFDEEVECNDEQCNTKCTSCNCTLCISATECPQQCLNCCSPTPCENRRCCVKTCHASCRSSSCRTECKNSCIEEIKEKENQTKNAKEFKKNITTTINLFNFLNNSKPSSFFTVEEISDILDNITEQENRDYVMKHEDNGENEYITNITVGGRKDEILSISEKTNSTPQINATKVIEGINRNQHIEATERKNISTLFNIREGLQEGCCYVIGPKECVPIQEYPFVRCFHLRKKQCGKLCKSHTMHEQFHEACRGNQCHEHTMYIPQPQPRCIYNPTWPYVTCGLPQQPPFCGGCYNHYSSPYPQIPPQECMFGCYDDGYGIGPYYRQGPFYRPGFFHVPSCYQTHICNSFLGSPFPFYGEYPPHTYDTNIHVQSPDKPLKTVEKDENEQRIEEPYNLNPWQYNTFTPGFSAPLDEVPRDVRLEASMVEPLRATITIDSFGLEEQKEEIVQQVNVTDSE